MYVRATTHDGKILKLGENIGSFFLTDVLFFSFFFSFELKKDQITPKNTSEYSILQIARKQLADKRW